MITSFWDFMSWARSSHYFEIIERAHAVCRDAEQRKDYPLAKHMKALIYALERLSKPGTVGEEEWEAIVELAQMLVANGNLRPHVLENFK